MHSPPLVHPRCGHPDAPDLGTTVDEPPPHAPLVGFDIDIPTGSTVVGTFGQTRTDQTDGLLARPAEFTVDGDGVRMRAQWRHQATVVSISGVVDAVTSDRVQEFATRYIPVGNAVALDMSGVNFFSARGISVLVAVDDACGAAAVPWALIPGPIVSRVLRLTECGFALPKASSVPDAMRQVTALTQARRQLALVTTTATRQ